MKTFITLLVFAAGRVIDGRAGRRRSTARRQRSSEAGMVGTITVAAK